MPGEKRKEPALVVRLPPVVEIAAGSHHTFARTASGAVYCWGLNAHGQLGIGGETMRERPIQVMDAPARATR